MMKAVAPKVDLLITGSLAVVVAVAGCWLLLLLPQLLFCSSTLQLPIRGSLAV